MSLLPALVTAALLFATPPDSAAGAASPPRSGPAGVTMIGPTIAPVALSTREPAEADTIRRRPRAVSYSDSYATRLRIHKVLSWAMLPLFAASYASGDQLLSKGNDAPQWAESLHPVAAGGTAVLFGANAVTGAWNLWEGRKDPNGRARRIAHSVLFLAASGGFAYAGSIAEDAKNDGDKRQLHRNVALGSMGVSTASWLLMLIGN